MPSPCSPTEITLISKEFFIRTKIIRVFSFNYPSKKIYMKPENLQELVCFKLTMIITCKSNIEELMHVFIRAFCLTQKDDQRSTRALPAYYQRTPSVLPVTTSVLPALLQLLHQPHAPEPTFFNNQSQDCDVETWAPSVSRA
jgi:hypothetical protein